MLEDLIGKTFGKLTVIGFSHKDKNSANFWLCQCSCINSTKKIVRQQSLKTGRTKSCGCSHRGKPEHIDIEDLTDKKFGRLTVLGIAQYDTNGKERIWICQCECNEFCAVKEPYLKTGRTKSCGCLKLEKISQQRKVNRYVDMGNYYEGYTHDNKMFLFDKEDFELIVRHSWCSSRGYLETRANQKIIRMHRLITGASEGEDVDHINHNPMDNRKENLRRCSHKENCSNTSISKNNTSGQTGVIFNEGKWDARIKHNYYNLYIGRFDTFEEAVEARIAKEIELFGEFSPYYKKEDS